MKRVLSCLAALPLGLVCAGVLWLILLATFGLTFGVVFSGLLLCSLIAVVYSYRFQRRGVGGLWLTRVRRGFYGVVSVWAISVVIVFIGVLPVPNPSIPSTASHLLVLGAGLWEGDRLSLVLETRLSKAAQVLHEHPRLQVVVSGGQGPDETISEALAMQRYLVAHGVAASRIRLESRSRTTRESLQFSLQLLRGEPVQGPLLLLTSEFHLYRAQRIASRLGVQPLGIAASTPRWIWVNYALREYFALLKALWTQAD